MSDTPYDREGVIQRAHAVQTLREAVERARRDLATLEAQLASAVTALDASIAGEDVPAPVILPIPSRWDNPNESIHTRVRALFNANPWRVYSSADIIALLNLPLESEGAVRQVLRRMTNAQELLRAGRGDYQKRQRG